MVIGEAKLKRVITPDVMKQPLYKLPKGAQEEEKVSSKSGVGGFTKSSISSTMIGKDI